MTLTIMMMASESARVELVVEQRHFLVKH